jgi:hypothetical protein
MLCNEFIQVLNIRYPSQELAGLKMSRCRRFKAWADKRHVVRPCARASRRQRVAVQWYRTGLMDI